MKQTDKAEAWKVATLVLSVVTIVMMINASITYAKAERTSSNVTNKLVCEGGYKSGSVSMVRDGEHDNEYTMVDDEDNEYSTWFENKVTDDAICYFTK